MTGLRAAFAGSALVYGAGCAISATAPVMEAMLPGRLVQGFGGGGLVALAFIAVSKLFDRSIWPQLFALLSAIWGVSAFCGPLTGGLFAQADWWRGAFWTFGIKAVVLTCAVYIIIPAQPVAAQSDRLDSATSTARPATGVNRKVDAFPARRLALLAASVISIAWSGITGTLLAGMASGAAGIAGLCVFLLLDQNRASGHILRASSACSALPQPWFQGPSGSTVSLHSCRGPALACSGASSYAGW